MVYCFLQYTLRAYFFSGVEPFKNIWTAYVGRIFCTTAHASICFYLFSFGYGFYDFSSTVYVLNVCTHE